MIYEGHNPNPADLLTILQPGDTLTNGRNRIIYQGPTPDDPREAVTTIIQRAVRAWLARKHAGIHFPDDLRCPLSLSLFWQPVCASDGVTYEMSWIQRFINQQNRWPCRGPSGIEMPGPNLVVSRSVYNATDHFRTQHRMAAMRHFDVPVYQPAPAPHHAPPLPLTT